jgi:hypothetical protein
MRMNIENITRVLLSEHGSIDPVTNRCDHCGKELVIGDFPFCPHGIPHGGIGIQAIHSSERSVIYRNPRTGEHRTPARADQPVPEVYAKQGYVREELSTPAAIKRFEKEAGVLHERTHYNPGSGLAEKHNTQEAEPYKRDPEVTKRLVQALR